MVAICVGRRRSQRSKAAFVGHDFWNARCTPAHDACMLPPLPGCIRAVIEPPNPLLPSQVSPAACLLYAGIRSQGSKRSENDGSRPVLQRHACMHACRGSQRLHEKSVAVAPAGIKYRQDC
ncbi:hypothetical protein B296_00050181 [Ensete ventricosum]|uniref:Uncharacterized protein n=1 Tax=Ensete ventricosum TaxID=4639 RepID=A0A426XD07_ENSVE|nr:hypothetical protein B296_00050181 [Ensete ventricosum]